MTDRPTTHRLFRYRLYRLASALPVSALLVVTAQAEHRPPMITHHAADAPDPDHSTHMPGLSPVMMDQGTYLHGIFNQFEGRYGLQENNPGNNPGGTGFRWDGELWFGSDYNLVWLRSEGTLSSSRAHASRLTDGQHELLYSHAASTYWNLQTGLRLDLDDGPTRAWAALGVQGLALYQFELTATGYVGGNGGAAARIEGLYDILLTNRLILQPQIELNAYTRPDPARGYGAGLSSIDAGLRLRYEHWRKAAPYVAVTYDSPLGQARHFRTNQSDGTGAVRVSFGVRSWF